LGTLRRSTGRQVAGVADADGYFPRGQQRRHQDVVGPAHHQDDTGRLGAQALEQQRQQSEFGVVGEADAEHRSAGRGIEGRRPADRGGDRVQRRRQQRENFRGPRGGLHAAPGAHEQRIVEQPAQARQGGADGWLAEKQFFRGAGHAALVHQGFEHDQQVQIDATQVVTVHVVRFCEDEEGWAG
jgi:hypothetical protein